jgi:hypothetical protein
VFAELPLRPVRIVSVVQDELAQMLIAVELHFNEFHGQFSGP